MTTIGFCGLGQMGAPMAARLLDGGHQLTVWNRTAERGDPLVQRGARAVASPAEAAAGAAVVVTMLSTPEVVEHVLFGDGGVAGGLDDGAVVVEMSTVGPAAISRIRARLPDEVALVDAPVLGSVPQATEGTLKVFVGGEDADVERVRAVLEALGRPIHLGPLGAGASMKLVVNSTLGAAMAGLAEALALADAFGLDEATVLDILSESPLGVTVKGKRANIESGRYPPNFKLALAVKDLRLVGEAAEAAGVDTRLAAAALAWMRDADAAGLGRLDYSAIIAHARGREARGPE